MKVLHINCVYGEGSTGKLVRDIHHTILREGNNSIVVYPLKNKYVTDPNVYVCSNNFFSYASAIYRRLSGDQFGGAYAQTNKIIHIIKKEKPDVVHLHCINGNNINVFRLLNFLSKEEIKTVYTLHAEFPYTGGCGHAYECEKRNSGCGNCPILKEATQSLFIDQTARTWKKLYSCYNKFKRENLYITAVSPWLENRAKTSVLLGKFSITTILNGVDTSIFYYKSVDFPWEKFGLQKNEKFIFHATASFSPLENNLKGGKFIYELARKLEHQNIKILVAANYIGELGNKPENVICVGRIADQKQLAQFYSAATLTLITSKRETFSMPTAESLCCGTPVVGFLAGGPESIALKDYSDFVPYADMNQLHDVLINWISHPVDKQEISRVAKDIYSKENMTNKYLQIYNVGLN